MENTQKETWVTPELVCIGRSNPEETVLAKCNENGLGLEIEIGS